METPPKNLLSNQPPKQISKPYNSYSGSSQSALNLTLKMSLVFVVGLILGALLMWFLPTNQERRSANNNNNNSQSLSTTTNNTNNNGAVSPTPSGLPLPVSVSGTNDLEANDQAAGNTATINMITLSVPGWVAIHEDRDGTLGNVLGAGRFDPGIYLGEIALLRNMVSGGTYYAVLYQDDGDRVFNTTLDAPILNAKGEIISSVFAAN